MSSVLRYDQETHVRKVNSCEVINKYVSVLLYRDSLKLIFLLLCNTLQRKRKNSLFKGLRFICLSLKDRI